jgi:hypothetical protein
MGRIQKGDSVAGWLSILIQFKHQLCFSEIVMDCAAQAGHLEVLIWLHINRAEGCTTNAMESAALCGHLEIVKWLHTNRTEGCTTHAMGKAADHGHLDVVKWLQVNRTECHNTTL